MDTSSVSEQERQSSAAVSSLESAMFPLDKPESEDVWSLVFLELPTTASSSGLARPLMRLEEGLEDFCLCCLELVLVTGVVRCMVIIPCGAVLTLHLDFWRGNGGPLSVMMVK